MGVLVGLLGTGGAAAQAQATPRLGLQASTLTAVSGQRVSFFATVQRSGPTSTAPTGTVTFAGAINPAVTVRLTTPVTGRQEAATVAAFGPGSYTVVATYNGDANFTASGPVSITVTVVKAATATALSAVESSAHPGRWTVTANVRAVSPARGTPTGSVVFTVDDVAGRPVPLGGSAIAYLHIVPAPGIHTVRISYSGDTRFTGSTGSTDFAAAAAPASPPGTATAAAAGTSPETGGTVFLRTVPALAGVRLAVGSAVVTTDSSGSATAQVADLNSVGRTVGLADRQLDADTILTLRKVITAAHTTRRESHVIVALDTASLVRLHIDPGESGVPASSIRSLRLHSIGGQKLTVDPASGPVLLLSSRRVRLSHGVPAAQPVTWSVDRIDAGPHVALTTAHPRFDPLGDAVWDVTLLTVHGNVQVSTVPATAGVSFLLGAATLTTGPNGTASGVADDVNDVAARLTLKTQAVGSISVALTGVTTLKPPGPGQRRLIATLAVSRPVTLAFVDASGVPVDPRPITGVSLRGEGSTVRIAGSDIGKPVMLLSSVATRVDNTWQPRTFAYTVESVRVHGANAVFAGQQQFDPNKAMRWPVHVAVFELNVTVHDALLGTRVRSQLTVVQPDGTSYSVHVGGGKATLVPSLVRGLYDFKVGAAAFGGPTAVLVSRNDGVDVRVFTVLDIVIAAVTTLVLVVVVMTCGRLLARRARTRTVRPAGLQPA